MKKLRKYSALRKAAWDIQSRVIRQLERGVCFTCGIQKHWKKMDLGHCLHGDSLDFDLFEGYWTRPRWLHCQCSRCNRFLHGNQTVYTNKLVKLYGPEIGDIMLKQKNEIRKFSREELETIILVYETIQRVEGLE